MSQLSIALVTARTYLNDDLGQVWSDNALLPKAQEAHRELQIKLWNVGSPAVRKQSDPILVNAGQTSLTLPMDLIQPFKLQEFGQSETIDQAVDMTEKLHFPNVARQNNLIWWAWREQQIAFLGANSARNVVIHYRKTITVPAAPGDEIGILFGEVYLGARTAAISHGSVGNKEAAVALAGECERNFNLVLMAQRGQQTPPYRP